VPPLRNEARTPIGQTDRRSRPLPDQPHAFADHHSRRAAVVSLHSANLCEKRRTPRVPQPGNRGVRLGTARSLTKPVHGAQRLQATSAGSFDAGTEPKPPRARRPAGARERAASAEAALAPRPVASAEEVDAERVINDTGLAPHTERACLSKRGCGRRALARPRRRSDSALPSSASGSKRGERRASRPSQSETCEPTSASACAHNPPAVVEQRESGITQSDRVGKEPFQPGSLRGA